ncbi:CDP-paratose 2-epimerase [Candidatus Magnetomorum sp. HK-1]|nr:CDP-paratose 2-epimerase [Candidatus Magnetomorum sp. HK-1]
MEIQNKKILITGGAGFIGTNVAAHFQKKNHIIIVDNLFRKGTEKNLSFLKKNYPIDYKNIDISKENAIDELLKNFPKVDIIFHLASQVAVTTSVINPQVDFQINAQGTFNILEYARKLEQKPIVIYSSTNKVYGAIKQFDTIEKKTRYTFSDIESVDENCPLDFHSPYGCSKGCGDQYVRDYYRMYKIPGVVFRQSCIYGDHQYGMEDQGWIAWFLIASILNKKITVYGNGKQVRDILYITDLINAYEKAICNIDKVKGEIFNIGGGASNSISILEFFDFIKHELDINIPLEYSSIRPGDQKIFISNNNKLMNYLGWKPEVDYKVGIKKLYNWIKKVT